MTVHNTVDKSKMQVAPLGGDTQEILQAAENHKPQHY